METMRQAVAGAMERHTKEVEDKLKQAKRMGYTIELGEVKVKTKLREDEFSVNISQSIRVIKEKDS